eukprot:2073537-Rhodomonas_salina.1
MSVADLAYGAASASGERETRCDGDRFSVSGPICLGSCRSIFNAHAFDVGLATAFALLRAAVSVCLTACLFVALSIRLFTRPSILFRLPARPPACHPVVSFACFR